MANNKVYLFVVLAISGCVIGASAIPKKYEGQKK